MAGKRRLRVAESSSDEDDAVPERDNKVSHQKRNLPSPKRSRESSVPTPAPGNNPPQHSSSTTTTGINPDLEDSEYPQLAEADENTLRILVATDNHVGFLEGDTVRGDDSFRTLEEIFQIGQRYKADMVLFGGDLFHDNKPSRRTVHRVLSIFRKYSLGSGAVPIEILSDQKSNFKQSPNGQVNYEDPNLSVQLPVFIIHGNHDDPTRDKGLESLSAVDLLSITGLVNYFGKVDKLDEVNIDPVLIAKGTAKLALYGMGWIRDERLNRLFSNNKVNFNRPSTDTTSWFNLFAVHQNRENKGRGAKNCLSESMIPDFMNLVVFGHEHECLLDAVESASGGVYLSQPGSSVATSLTEGEAREKQVGILDVVVRNGEPMFRLVGVPLRTVRPFIASHVELSDKANCLNSTGSEKEVEQAVETFLSQVVDNLIDAARDHPNARPVESKDPLALPLIRLKVEHTGFPTVGLQRFGGKFVGRVANPKDILQFYRKRNPRSTTKKSKTGNAMVPMEPVETFMDDSDKQERILDMVTGSLQSAAEGLKVLPVLGLNKAVEEFVVKESNQAFEVFTRETLQGVQETLVNEASIANDKDLISALDDNILGNQNVVAPDDTASDSDDDDGVMSSIAKVPSKKKRSKSSVVESESDQESVKPASKKSSRTKRPARTTTQKSVANFFQPKEQQTVSDDDEEYQVSDGTQFSDSDYSSHTKKVSSKSSTKSSRKKSSKSGSQPAKPSTKAVARPSTKRAPTKRGRRGAKLGNDSGPKVIAIGLSSDDE